MPGRVMLCTLMIVTIVMTITVTIIITIIINIVITIGIIITITNINPIIITIIVFALTSLSHCPGRQSWTWAAQYNTWLFSASLN